MSAADHANTIREWPTDFGQHAHAKGCGCHRCAALDALQAQAEAADRLRGYLDITRGERDEWARRAEAAEAERDAAVRAGEKLLAYWEPPPRGTREYDFWEPPDGKTTRRILAEFRAALAEEDKP